MDRHADVQGNLRLRTFRHWTPHYVTCRLRQMLYQRRYPEEPWLTAEAVRILASLLRSDDRGFEWGSGRSTLWFSQRIQQLTSIENNASWYARVGADLQNAGRRNVRLELHETPSTTSSGDDVSYVSAIESEADESLGFVLVDGWGRDRCALAALPKVRRAGILVIDDVHRYLPGPATETAPGARAVDSGPANERWGEFLERVAPWRRIWTSDGISPTLILINTG